jgi:hypothetical protein
MESLTRTAGKVSTRSLEEKSLSSNIILAVMDNISKLATDGLLNSELASPSTNKNANFDAQSHKGTETSTVIVSKSAAKSFPWEHCPYEIRDAIFKTISDQYSSIYSGGYKYFKHNDYRTSPLVVALRRLPISYEHVLQWVAKETSPNIDLLSCNGSWDNLISRLTSSELKIFTRASLIKRW